MIDIKLIRENRDLVKENIKKKFQDEKLPLVDEVYELDKRVREVQTTVDGLKADKNKLSSEIGKLMSEKKVDEANKVKEKIAESADEIKKLEEEQVKLTSEIRDKMLVIPQIMDPSVPIGEDDSCNVEVEKFAFRQTSKGEDIYDIEATIYCLRESHKGIIIGKGGTMLKKISTYARQDAENMLGTKVNLKVWVKVKEDWQEKDNIVNKFKLK